MKRTTYSGTNTFTYEDTSHEDGLEYTVEYRYSGYYDPGQYSPKAIAGVLSLIMAHRVSQF